MKKTKAAKAKPKRNKRLTASGGIAQCVTFLVMTIAYDQTVRDQYLKPGNSWSTFYSWLLSYLKAKEDRDAVKAVQQLCGFLMPVPAGQSASMTDKINQTLAQQGVFPDTGDVIVPPVMRPKSWPVRK